MSGWGLIELFSDAESAKATACLQGLQLVTAYTGPVVLESDCLNLVNELCATNKSRLQIAFCVEENNCVAHSLASFSRILGEWGVLHSSVPPCAMEHVMKDCNLQVLSMGPG